MNSEVKSQSEIAAILNSFVYLDVNLQNMKGKNLQQIISEIESKCSGKPEFQQIKTAIHDNESFKEIQLVDQSSTNSTSRVTDDLIQACTFMDVEGNYYVSYRGTGAGRWLDNGKGMTQESTPMQEAATAYFDQVAEKYLQAAHDNGKSIIVTGHSKGGNEAQYVYMASEHEDIIDNCISFDGQGFSKEAVSGFIQKYGEGYVDKLKNMYSVCGENDYVHDLGIVIIPEKNTYYTKTEGDGLKEYHHIVYMIGDGDGNYSGLSLSTEDGKIVNGEQGEVGKFAKELSRNMMELDDEDLDGTASTLMLIIDLVMNIKNKKWQQLSKDEITGDDILDLLSDGPGAIEASVGDYIYDRYGVVGYAGLLASVGFFAFMFPNLVIKKKFVDVLDFIVDRVEKIEGVYEKISQFCNNVRNVIVSNIKKLDAWMKSVYGKGVSAGPYIEIDTGRMRTYAARIDAVNRGLYNLDVQMDTLYWKLGLLDILKLLEAGILTGYSYKLTKCAAYLETTADEFEKAEQSIVSN